MCLTRGAAGGGAPPPAANPRFITQAAKAISYFFLTEAPLPELLLVLGPGFSTGFGTLSSQTYQEHLLVRLG